MLCCSKCKAGIFFSDHFKHIKRLAFVDNCKCGDSYDTATDTLLPLDDVVPYKFLTEKRKVTDWADCWRFMDLGDMSEEQKVSVIIVCLQFWRCYSLHTLLSEFSRMLHVVLAIFRWALSWGWFRCAVTTVFSTADGGRRTHSSASIFIRSRYFMGVINMNHDFENAKY